MKILSINLLLFLFILLVGCSVPSYQPTTSTYHSTNNYRKAETITESLFHDKNSTISEENIQRLLDGKLQFGENLKIALFKYESSRSNYYWNNEEYLKTQQSFIDTLMYELKKSPKVQEVSLIPSIMIGNKPNITQLRETAVRLQADIVIVFSLKSDLYYKYKTFQKNEAKAFATCEVVLMDTRTSLVPHSNIITKEHWIKKEKEDWTNQEMRKKAENGAITLSLIEIGKHIVNFLNKPS